MVVLQQRWRAQCAMLRAVRAGDLSLLTKLLDSDLGLDCDMAFSISGAQRPAICLAIEQGHVKLVEELCQRRCSVSVFDKGGMTPLHLASSLGHTEIVELLLENRADIDMVTVATGETALHLATSGGHIATVKLLLERGAAVNKATNEGKTCLMVAARSGSLEIARLLVTAGAKRAMTDIRGNTALLLHCSGLGVNPAMLETLATNTVIDTSNWDGWWPLLAIVSGNHHNKSEAVCCLLRAGADVNTVTSLGYSALHTALHYSLPDIALLLVRAGADVTSQDFLGNSPLSLALAHQDLHMASILAAAGAPCHLTSSQRESLSEESKRWLQQQNGKTKSLKEISRLAVRGICTRKLDTFLVEAEIPKTLKQYVYFLLE